MWLIGKNGSTFKIVHITEIGECIHGMIHSSMLQYRICIAQMQRKRRMIGNVC